MIEKTAFFYNFSSYSSLFKLLSLMFSIQGKYNDRVKFKQEKRNWYIQHIYYTEEQWSDHSITGQIISDCTKNWTTYIQKAYHKY